MSYLYKFRIKFKIALLTQKCSHKNAPKHLKEFICICFTSSDYCLLVNNDKWLLQNVSYPNVVKSESISFLLQQKF